MINWFESTQKTNSHSFICFDVCNFYPSITEQLLEHALNFASRYTTITAEQRDIIKHTKKTLLFHKGTPWIKKNGIFDVTMGSYDGAETCELVGIFLLSKLSHLKINCGLYRDDGLAMCDQTPRQTENIKKEICRIFKSFGLTITIDANKKAVDFLDITLDIKTNTFKPYVKPNNKIHYVNKNSCHPRTVIKNLPESVNKRISTNSKTETIFNNASKTFKDALNKSGYNYKMKFTPQTSNIEKQQNERRERNSIDTQSENTNEKECSNQTNRTK